LINRESYEEDNSDRKKMRACKWPKLEAKLVKWIETMRMFHKEPVSKVAIVEDFKESNGWIEKFIR
jgi:hypothetical protein